MEKVAGARVEIRLLGGLSVLVDGVPIAFPSGTSARALALLAVRGPVHVEELTDLLWPEASAEVGRRRLRNVLARVRSAAGPIILRTGERVELDADVVVDHHELDRRVRHALAMPPGLERAQLLHAALADDRGPLLPEAVYEEWTGAARERAEARRAEVLHALEAERARR